MIQAAAAEVIPVPIERPYLSAMSASSETEEGSNLDP
jgi:hypothetical protein